MESTGPKCLALDQLTSKVEQSKTAGAGAIVYSAPEMFPHDDFSTPPPPQTTKVDVFSYGVLLLEVILKEIPSINKRHSMLQQVKKQWEEMYDLIFLFTKPNPLDRPNMADILHKLYRLPNNYYLINFVASEFYIFCIKLLNYELLKDCTQSVLPLPYTILTL